MTAVPTTTSRQVRAVDLKYLAEILEITGEGKHRWFTIARLKPGMNIARADPMQSFAIPSDVAQQVLGELMKQAHGN